MRSLLPLTVYCISLFTLQQLLALPVEERLESDRKPSDRTEVEASVPEGRTDTFSSSSSSSEPSSARKRSTKRLAASLRRAALSNAREAFSGLAWARPAVGGRGLRPRAQRTRRQAHALSRSGHGHHHRSSHHHAQLMRVGCVLGTCQVQNLSHRIYQLIGQSGREDSSPINPRSPHSYG